MSGCPTCGSQAFTSAEQQILDAAQPDQPLTEPFVAALDGLQIAQLKLIASYLAPLVPAFFQNWSGSSLPSPQTIGSKVLPIQLSTFIPAGCRSVLLRNLSPTKALTYAYVDTPSQPSQYFQTLPANQPLALDIVPKKLSVYLDNTNGDAAFEVTFFV